MKTFPCIPTVIVALWLAAAGCSDASRERTLVSAEAMMEQHPDSALTLLSSLDGSRLSGELRARHALLTSQALDKNYIDITDDSIINIALDYYSANPQHERRLSQAFYYKGVIDFNGGDNHMAIYHFAIADTLAARLGDTPLRAKANATIGLAMRRLTYLEEDLKYSEKALRFFELSGDSLRAANQRLNVATAYYQLNHTDIALKMLNQPDCASNIFIKSLCLLKSGDIEGFESMTRCKPQLQTHSKVQAKYSKILAESGRVAEAEIALEKALRYAKSSFDSASCLIAQGAIYYRKNLWREYAACADSANAVSIRDIQAIKRGSNPIGITNANAYISQFDRSKTNRQRYIMTIWIICGSLLLIAAIFLAAWLYRRDVRSRRKSAQAISLISAEYEEAKRIHKAEIDTALMQAAQTKEKLASLCESAISLDAKKAEEVRNINAEIKEMLNSGCMHELEFYVNITSDSLVARVRQTNLLEEEIKLLILMQAGFSNNQIEVLTGQSYDSISSRKYRLRKKLKSIGIDL